MIYSKCSGIPVRYYMVIFIITNNITCNISDTCVTLHLHSSYMCVLLDYMYIKYIKSSIYLLTGRDSSTCHSNDFAICVFFNILDNSI